MALSNTAVPKYYGMFRDAVIRGEIPVNREIAMEMERIDSLIKDQGVYYDNKAIEGKERILSGLFIFIGGILFYSVISEIIIDITKELIG